MPQLIAKVSDASAPSSKLLSIAAPPKPTAPRASFHEALKQVKSKATPPSAAPHKVAPKAGSKPTAKLASTSKRVSKPVPAKPEKPQAAQTSAKKPEDQHPGEDSQDDPNAKPQASDDSGEDPQAKSDGDNAPTDSGAASDAAASFVASQLAAATTAPISPTADAPKDSGDLPNDHKRDSKDGDGDTQASDSQPSVAAGQLTAQAVTAPNGASSQSGNQNGGQSDQPASDAAPAAAQSATQAPAAKAKPRISQSEKTPDPTDAQVVDPAQNIVGSTAIGPTDQAAAVPKSTTTSVKAVDVVLNKLSATQGLLDPSATSKLETAKSAAPSAPVEQRPEARFAEMNHPTIVSDIQGKLLPDGGSMDIQLSPPDLGPMHVRVEVRDGAITASFQAADEQTAKLLSHTLSDLKTALEAQGVSVEKLHVTQMPKEQQQSQNNNGSQNREADRNQQQAAQQEQQRKEMMRRMWRRLMKGQDPLDLVA